MMILKRKGIFIASSAVCAVLLVIAARPFFHRPLESMYRSSTAVYARNGELLRFTLSNDQRYRQWVPLKEISGSIKTSFIYSEDRFFYIHPGINPVSLVRAGWGTYFSGARRKGASTITMQLARMLGAFDSGKISGKIRQVVTALWLEYLYSKEEILEAYLNFVPMGGNIEGVGAASLIFFGKKPSELGWGEAMLLAVIPQNPNRRTLLHGEPEELKLARTRLFSQLEKFVPANEKPLVSLSVRPKHIRDLPFLAPHFVLNALDKEPAKPEIKTTLDLGLQKEIEKRLRPYLSTVQAKGVRNGSVLLVNWQTSEVLAWVGSSDFLNSSIQGQVDGVTSLRSPGSTLKPFIYALAIEQGLIHPRSVLKDSPRYFGAYDPENFDGKFQGPLPAEVALNESRNLPAIELMSKLSGRDFYQFLVDSEVGKPRNREFYGHSIAIGGYETTLLELVSLYSILPRQGYFRRPVLSGSERKKSGASKGLLTQEASFLVLDMLSRAHLHSNRFQRLERRESLPVSWKTGTSSGFRDAWTVGVFGQYALGVWMGNFSGEGNRAFIGRELAAPLFFQLVDTIRLRQKIELSALSAWRPGRKIQKVSVCPLSGKIPGPHCRHTESVFFIPGTSPIAKCDVHRQIWVSKNDGKLSCHPDPVRDRPEIHEFWPSDILEIYKAAGLPRKGLPAPGPSCKDLAVFETLGRGPVPEILSPREGTTYSLRSSVKTSRLIPFQGNHDSSAKEIFWFVDNEFVGKSSSGKELLWKARAGTFYVNAIDDKGRSSSRQLKVNYVE